ncbi:MAG: hypothetical protein AAFX04_04510 [Pseudomonadota bacterium]
MMMTDTTGNGDSGASALDRSAASVASLAHRYAQWTSMILLLVTAYYVWEEIGEPVISSLSSSGYYPMDTALGHVANNLATSIAVVPLLWGAWELRCFLHRLAATELWAAATAQHLKRVGIAIALAGLAALFVSPVLVALVHAEPFSIRSIDYDPIYLALIVVSALLYLVARVFTFASQAAQALNAENSQFI